MTFIYDKIHHNGISYNSLMSPDFMLIPRGYKVWPRWVTGEGWTAGELYHKSTTGVRGLQPFHYRCGAKLDHWAGTKNLQNMLPPDGWDLEEYLISNPQAKDLDKIDSKRVLDILKNRRPIFDPESQDGYEQPFIYEVKPNVKHTLYLDITFYKYIVYRLRTYKEEEVPPDSGEYETHRHWKIVQKGYYGAYGTAFALL
jgi:hypothetical protein